VSVFLGILPNLRIERGLRAGNGEILLITSSTRRIALVLALGASTFATIGVARAQTKVTSNGITGTDPVPKGCGCVAEPPPSTSSVSTSSTVAQAMLVFLGVA
jgi:hypothetical protein